MHKVLVIDDSATVRAALERILTRRSVKVASAANGTSGVARMLEEVPDLIICNFVLPDRDGVSLARFVRNHPLLKAIPFLLVSGAVTEGEERQALAAGCTAIVREPVSAEALLSLVDQSLASPAAVPARAPAPGPPVSQVPGPARAGAARILVVDDSFSVRVALERILARKGYGTTGVSSAEAAFELLERESFDLVITDLVMPGEDGVAVVRFLKESRRHGTTPVLVISGLTNDDLDERARAAGCDDVVRKPFTPETLLPKVESLLRKSPFGGPSLLGTVAPAMEVSAPPVLAAPSAPAAPSRASLLDAMRLLGELPGVESVILTDTEGQTVEAAYPASTKEVPEPARQLAALVAPLGRLGAASSKGRLRSATILYERGFLCLITGPGSWLLVVSLEDLGQLGLLHLFVRKRLPRLLDPSSAP